MTFPRGRTDPARPKLYLVDASLACHLLGIRSERQLATHHMLTTTFQDGVAYTISIFYTMIECGYAYSVH